MEFHLKKQNNAGRDIMYTEMPYHSNHHQDTACSRVRGGFSRISKKYQC